MPNLSPSRHILSLFGSHFPPRHTDYGPFGFIEKFDPDWAMWIGGGQHFSFANQPQAAGVNLRMWLGALEPLLDARGVGKLREISASYSAASDNALGRMWARKLGLPQTAPRDIATEQWRACSVLLARHPTDWTVFWRQLSEVPAAANQTTSTMLDLLAPAFYAPLEPPMRAAWSRWLTEWLAAMEDAYTPLPDVEAEAHEVDEWMRQRTARAQTRADALAAGTSIAYAIDGIAIGEGMRAASPKYVPREWMLVEAYEAAERGDYAPLHALHAVLSRPYDEQPEVASRFYRRAPHGSDQQGGVGFMS